MPHDIARKNSVKYKPVFFSLQKVWNKLPKKRSNRDTHEQVYLLLDLEYSEEIVIVQTVQLQKISLVEHQPKSG